MTIHIDHLNLGGIWDAELINENKISIKTKKYYKMGLFYFFSILCIAVIVGIIYFIPDQLLSFTFSISFFIFCGAMLYILVFDPIRKFQGFNIEINNGELFVNNKNASEVCIFAVCDPDDLDFNKNQDIFGVFGFDGNGTSEGGPSIKIGFQFKSKNEIFYARGNLESSGRKGMEVIYDFLLKNKIKFSYKYKEIRPHLLCLRNQFKQFENEFDLDNIKQIETDVQSTKRHIRKDDKYPSDGVLEDQNKNQQS